MSTSQALNGEFGKTGVLHVAPAGFKYLDLVCCDSASLSSVFEGHQAYVGSIMDENVVLFR